MGKFGNLTFSELCEKMVRAARFKSWDEDLKKHREKDGLIAIGVQPLTAEAEEWTGAQTGGKIALYNYPLVKDGCYGRRFRPRLGRIESDMELSARNKEKHLFSEEWPVDSDIGSTCSYEIRDYKTNEVLMRISIFVSGEVNFARECCYAARRFIGEWTQGNSYTDYETGELRHYLYTPHIHHYPAIPETAAEAS